VVKVKISRNDPCPCGSGRKFKRCCLAQQNDAQRPPEIDSNDIVEHEPDGAAFARALAEAIASGELPLKVQDILPEVLAARVDTLLDFLDSFLEASAESAVAGAQELSEACLQLLEIQLTNVRFLSDRDFVAAKRLLQQFEERLIGAIRQAEVRSETIALIGTAMFNAGLALSPELAAVCQELFDRQPAVDINNCDPSALLQQALRASGGDPFDLSQAISSAVHIGDPLLRAAAVHMMLGSQDALIRDAAALAVLDPVAAVRKETALALVKVCDTLTPTTLRRLSLVQRWLPEDERELVEPIIDGARQSGVECEQWPSGKTVVEIHGSGLDGAGAQTNLMIIRAEKRLHQLAGLLFKQGRGLAEAWIGEPEPKREITQMIKSGPATICLMPVSRAYLNGIVSYYLRICVERRQPPPAALLKIAEATGTQWQPSEVGWQNTLEEMLASVPQEILAPMMITAIISSSDRWGLNGPWAASWFEDNQEVADLVMNMDGQPHDAVRDALLDGIIENHRDIWAERFALTAFWMREASAAKRLPWHGFAILAGKLLSEDVPLGTIPLMRKIAEDTVEVIRQPDEDLEDDFRNPSAAD